MTSGSKAIRRGKVIGLSKVTKKAAKKPEHTPKPEEHDRKIECISLDR